MALIDAVDEALASTPHEGRDGATVALARFYAAAIDDVPDADMVATLRDLGPKLLAALEALNMSPRSRAAVKGAASGAAGTGNPLDQLRARREQRAAGAD